MKELVITPPKGFEVDKEHSTFEKIVFKPIDSKPRSWKEYALLMKGEQLWRLSANGIPFKVEFGGFCDYLETNQKTYPSEELAKAFLAMMQLMSLRQAWIGEWKLNLRNDDDKFMIVNYRDSLDIITNYKISHPLSFPTREMAQEFLGCFKDLIEIAKPLI